jgi:dolichol-phosphate mannosyltransferase
MLDSREKNFVSAVIYVHDCEDRIGAFVQAVIKTLDEHFEHSEVICVNDASQDKSVERIRSAARETGCKTSVSLLNLSYFHGLEPSMNAGRDLAIGDFVYEFDAALLDFKTDDIMAVYHKSLEGFDIVSAVPETKQRKSSSMFYSLMNRYGQFPYRFCTERFRILSRRAINRIGNLNREIVYRKTAYAGCGLKSAQIRYNPENCGILPQNRAEALYRRDLAANSLLLFTSIGYRLSMLFTALMGLFCLGIVIYSIVVYILSDPIRGWTSTILFLSAAFFGLFAILTVIIRYLQILLELSFKRKSFTFESIEKIMG